jgi:predicted amidohydrolase
MSLKIPLAQIDILPGKPDENLAKARYMATRAVSSCSRGVKDDTEKSD